MPRPVVQIGLLAKPFALAAMMPSGLAGKTVLVTGGSRGIGRAIVERFAAEGADVTFYYRENARAAQSVVDAAKAAGQKVAAEQLDVRNFEACAAAAERVFSRTEGIDVLVNNAGPAWSS